MELLAWQAREELSGEVGKVVAGQVGEVVAGQSGARKAEEENMEGLVLARELALESLMAKYNRNQR